MKKNTNKNTEIIKRIKTGITGIGYTDDPRLIPQIKNTALYHRVRRKMFSGSMISTVAEIDEKFNAIRDKYPLLLMGFWSVYPVLFTTVYYEDILKEGFRNYLIRYQRDVFDFMPYTAKCIVRITIWPKVEVRSTPHGYMVILFPEGIKNENIIEEYKKEWQDMAGYEKFGLLPPIFADLNMKQLLHPFSRTELMKYPPSLSELKKMIFE